ncbi:MAG: UPF0158 family protein [Actinomycetota bacterium]
MLGLSSIDLNDLAGALEDHDWEHAWWFVPASGEIEMTFADSSLRDEADFDPDEAKAIRIEPLPSHVGYGDMQDFIVRVRDPRIRADLDRAIAGRGAFRRFKDALFERPELRDLWFAFHDARMRRRAIEWLREEDQVSPEEAIAAIAEIREPDAPEIGGAFDARRIAQAFAEDLKGLYGDRLKAVMLFGSWARGDAHPESDIDLLVVLDRFDSWAQELRRMAPIADLHSDANETVLCPLVVDEKTYLGCDSPTLIRASIEGERVV